MKNIFTPVFLTTLTLLFWFHRLDSAGLDYRVFLPVALAAAVLAALFYAAGKLELSYVLIALAIGLIITARFVQEKDAFYRLSDSFTPPEQYVYLEGRLTDFPEIRKDHSMILLETVSLEFARQRMEKRFKIRIKVNGNLKNFYRGDMVGIDAKIYKNSFHRNFYRDSMEDYLLVRGNHLNGYCKSVRMITRLKKSSLPWRLAGGWRNRVRRAIEDKYTGPGGDLGVKGVFLQAILIGERGKLNNRWKEKLIGAGVYHLLAISGAHIGIIALLFLGVLKLLKVSFRKRYIVTAVVLVVFLVLSGFKISAQRAVIMALFIFAGRVLYLDINIFNIISLCGLFMLSLNPGAFLDAGFILTFSLTAAIIIGRRVFMPLFHAVVPLEELDDRGKEDESKHTVGVFLRKIAGGVMELVSANLCASLISLPLSLYYFKRYSLTGFVSGLVLVPLTAVITGLGILLIPLALLPPVFPGVLLAVVDIPLTIFFYVLEIVSGMAGPGIFRASPPVALVLLILTLFALLPVVRRAVVKIALSAVLLAALLFISLPIFSYSPGHLEVFYLDVGQGDAQVVVFPGGDALLLDGGGAYYSDFQVGRRIVLPFLLQKRIKIKWAAISHFHPDHAYGIAEMIHIIKPEEVWLSSAPGAEESCRRLMRALPASTHVWKVNAPFIRQVGNCTVEWLYPLEFIEARRCRNNHSQVIKISDNHHSFLFTGDIEREVEGLLVEDYCSRLGSTVIKVPHHGSASSSGREFLKCVSPSWAIFSYAANNRFGFPHEEVLKNYRRQGTAYLSTARVGGIKLTSLPGGIRIETSR